MSSKKRKKLRTNYEDYRTYYGIPHCHTSASTGKGTITEAVEYSKKNKLDYIIITDHNFYLSRKHKDEETKWSIQKEEISKLQKHRKKLLPMLGFEYKLFSKLDINVFGTDKCINKKLTVKEFNDWLKDNKGIGIINHPGESIDKIKNNLELNKYIRCIEVGNGSFPYKYKRYYKYYFQMLDLGWKLAAVNGQDNHKKNWGDTENVTAIFAKKINPNSVTEAYFSGRTYSTESKTLRIHFSINDIHMGETIRVRHQDHLNFRINIEDKKKLIKGIKVFAKGGLLIREEEQLLPAHSAELLFSIQCSEKSGWYVVNVLLQDGKEAITSPIFIEEH